MKIIAAILLMAASPALPQSYFVAYPGGGEGNSASGYPFNSSPGEGARYQQLYTGSRFFDVRPGGDWITHIAFRLDSSAGRSFGATLTGIQINLSTTSQDEGSLSPVFSANVGANETTVFGPGTATVLGVFSPGSSPQDFSIILRFSQPFFYNPAQGNLLLDIRDLSGNGPNIPAFDASDFNGDGVARVYAPGANLAAGTFDTTGLMTGFAFNTVPEPSTLNLLGLGVVVLGIIGFRTRMKGRKHSVD